MYYIKVDDIFVQSQGSSYALSSIYRAVHFLYCTTLQCLTM